MDAFGFVNEVIEKTRIGKLEWQTADNPYELWVRLESRGFVDGGYVLRMQNVLQPELTLESKKGQVIMRVSNADPSISPPTSQSMNELWKMIEIDGKSADEAAVEALNLLRDL